MGRPRFDLRYRKPDPNHPGKTLESHAEAFQKWSMGRNWRDFADWGVYWTLRDPAYVGFKWANSDHTDARWCFRGPIYFKTGDVTKVRHWYVITGKTTRRIITTWFSSRATGCTPDKGWDTRRVGNGR